MKIKFSSRSEVCHVWAQRSQLEGEAGNIFFVGDSIYSYGQHYKLAIFTDPSTALINSRTYSPSTSQHSSHVVNALPSFVKTFYVPNLGSHGGSPTKENHRENLRQYKKEFVNALATASRARLNVEDELSSAKHYMKKALEYAETFRVKKYLWKASKQQLEMLEGKGLKEFSKAEKVKRAKAKKIRDAREAEQKKADKARLASRMAEWLEGKHHSSYASSYPETLMRIKGSEVQTSKGAIFSKVEALKAFRFIKVIANMGVDWKSNGKTFNVGPNYQIDLISKNGDVKAGCHFIRYPEIERIGKLLESL